MDPDEAIKQLDQEIISGDRSDVRDSTGNLIQWLEQGGICPHFPEYDYRSKLEGYGLVCYLRDLRRVASMD